MTPKITLSDDVRRTLQEHPMQGASVEDDRTHMRYVLLPIDVYQQLESSIRGERQVNPDAFFPLAHEAFADDWEAPGMEAYDDYDSNKPAS